VVIGLYQPATWLCSRVHGRIGDFRFLNTIAARTKAEFPGTNAEIGGTNVEIHGMESMWFLVLIRAASGHLLALTCCIYTGLQTVMLQ